MENTEKSKSDVAPVQNNVVKPAKKGFPVWLIILIIVMLLGIFCCVGSFFTLNYLGTQKDADTGLPLIVDMMFDIKDKVPRDLPEKVPVLPRFNDVVSMETRIIPGTGWLMFTTGMAPEEIVAFYEISLEEAGWGNITSGVYNNTTKTLEPESDINTADLTKTIYSVQAKDNDGAITVMIYSYDAELNGQDSPEAGSLPETNVFSDFAKKEGIKVMITYVIPEK